MNGLMLEKDKKVEDNIKMQKIVLDRKGKGSNQRQIN